MSVDWGRKTEIGKVIHLFCSLAEYQANNSTKNHRCRVIRVSPRPKPPTIPVNFASSFLSNKFDDVENICTSLSSNDNLGDLTHLFVNEIVSKTDESQGGNERIPEPKWLVGLLGEDSSSLTSSDVMIGENDNDVDIGSELSVVDVVKSNFVVDYDHDEDEDDDGKNENNADDDDDNEVDDNACKKNAVLSGRTKKKKIDDDDDDEDNEDDDEEEVEEDDDDCVPPGKLLDIKTGISNNCIEAKANFEFGDKHCQAR